MEDFYFVIFKLITDIGPVLTSDYNVLIEADKNSGTITKKLGSSKIFDFNNENDQKRLQDRYPDFRQLINLNCDRPCLQNQESFELIKNMLTNIGYSGLWVNSHYGILCLVFKLSDLENGPDYKNKDHVVIETELSFNQIIRYISESNLSVPNNYFNFYGITKEEITKKQFKTVNLEAVNIKVGWNNGDQNIQPSSVPKNIHTMRIAKLVKEIKTSGFRNPIEFKFDVNSAQFSIVDGHHRIRALRYLNLETFPAIISGSQQMIDKIIKLKK